MKMRLIFFHFLLFFEMNLLSQRVISLMPSYTEIIFELGGGDNIVGVTNFCSWPEQARKITSVGDYLNPDLEMIYRLKPDIIFMGEWKNDIVKRFAKDKKINIVVIPQEKTVDDIYGTIRIISKYLKKENKANEIIRDMKKKLSENREAKIKTFKKVYVDIDYDFWTCGSDSFISDVISKSGGINIFNDIRSSYFKTGWEEILKRNPDVIIILSSRNREDFHRLPLSEKISAVKNSQIYRLTDTERDILSRPSPRIVQIIRKLSDIFNMN